MIALLRYKCRTFFNVNVLSECYIYVMDIVILTVTSCPGVRIPFLTDRNYVRLD